jgi:ribonuclease HII
MATRYALRCRNCKTPYPADDRHACERCLGPLEVVYDLDVRGEALRAAIEAVALAVGVGWVGSRELDCLGLGAANREALRRAVAALSVPADYLLLDAFPLPGVPLPQRAIVRGDRECLSIAAASIVAKVARDRALVRLDGGYPAYGFARHKGYGTRDHQAAILEHGPCPEHRLSFAPLRPHLPSPGEP